jgi:hypothetical protein
VTATNEAGRQVLRTTPDGKAIFLTGNGASPEGTGLSLIALI